jgi:hypothetical protein
VPSILGHFSDEFLQDALIDIFELDLVSIIIVQTCNFGHSQMQARMCTQVFGPHLDIIHPKQQIVAAHLFVQQFVKQACGKLLGVGWKAL